MDNPALQLQQLREMTLDTAEDLGILRRVLKIFHLL